jgi:hypothetical protein
VQVRTAAESKDESNESGSSDSEKGEEEEVEEEVPAAAAAARPGRFISLLVGGGCPPKTRSHETRSAGFHATGFIYLTFL